MKLIKGKMYQVEWLDTFSFNGWWNDDELREKSKRMNYLQVSAGIFAGEDKNWIILATHKNPDSEFNTWGHPDWIPKGTIKSIKRLKV